MLVCRAGSRACHTRKQAGVRQLVLQGGVCRAARLRRIADCTSTVQIPEGVIGVKPMPKPGWTIETVKGKYAAEYENHGRKVSEGVKEVVWSGGKLADDDCDGFIVTTYLTGGLKPNTTLYFPGRAGMRAGRQRWIDIPKEGQGSGSGHDSASPAPGLKLIPKP